MEDVQSKEYAQASEKDGRSESSEGSPTPGTYLSGTKSTTPTTTRTFSTTNTRSHYKKRPRFTRTQLYEAAIHTLRVIFSTIYLIYIILTIPLSFEVGGLNCGLSYSLTILILYFGLATLRVLKYHRFISSFLYYMQHLLLPTLLAFFLTVFRGDSYEHFNGNGFASVGFGNGISEIATSGKEGASVFQIIWWGYIIKFWKFFLINSTPLFTILEGFCSLLSIQAIGQLFKYFIKNKSDSWMILNLILSSCILSTSIYFAGKIYASPLIDVQQVGLISASLLGSVFTLTTLITFYAIYFNRATTLESSLMVGYIVKCCYELFPELSKNNISVLFKFVFNEFKKIDNQAKQSLVLNNEHMKWSSFVHYLNTNGLVSMWSSYWNSEELSTVTNNAIVSRFPHIIDKLLNILHSCEKMGRIMIDFILDHFPRSFEPLWDFFKISINNLTFSILMQLAYRIAVFFAATKIIPILSSINSETALDAGPDINADTDADADADADSRTGAGYSGNKTSRANRQQPQSTSGRLIYLYSPCIIIAVYTNLMIQYNYEMDKETHLYTWIHKKVSEWIFTSLTENAASTATTAITAATTATNKYVTATATAIAENNMASGAVSTFFMPIHTWQFWNWINIFAVLLLYFSELLSYSPADSALTDNWN